MNSVEKAQRLRVIVLLLALAAFGGAELMALSATARIEAGAVRTVDIVQLLSPGLVAAGLARGVSSAPLLMRDSRARRAINDELAQDNQRRAAILGLFAAGLVAFTLACTAPFLQLEAHEAAHAIGSVLVAVTVLRFVWLEIAGVLKRSDAEWR
jgi:hypothetical protein